MLLDFQFSLVSPWWSKEVRMQTFSVKTTFQSTPWYQHLMKHLLRWSYIYSLIANITGKNLQRTRGLLGKDNIRKHIVHGSGHCVFHLGLITQSHGAKWSQLFTKSTWDWWKSLIKFGRFLARQKPGFLDNWSLCCINNASHLESITAQYQALGFICRRLDEGKDTNPLLYIWKITCWRISTKTQW